MIKNHSVRSVYWSLLGRYIPNLIQIISTLLIARLVTPEEFGEVAIITTFIQIASLLVSSGFSEALIYRVKNSELLYSTVFYTNIIISLFLYIVLFLISDYIASFYSIQRLGILTKVVGLNIIVYSFTYIHRMLYAIEINFKIPAIIDFVAALCGCFIGLLLAYHDFGVWAIVWQTLSVNLVQLLSFGLISKWRPIFRYSFVDLLKIIPYSSKILFNNIVQVVYDNIYSLVVGKVFNSKTLGYYNRMQTVSYFVTTNFLYAVENVFYPILCKNKEDKHKLVKSHELLLRLSTYIIFPILVILIALGEYIITLLLTDKWLGGVFILKILSMAYCFMPIIYISNSFLKIVNKPNVLFYTGIVKKAIGVSILIITMFYDIEVVCYGIALYYFIDALISMICTSIYIGVSVFRQIMIVRNNVILNVVLYFLIINISHISNGIWGKLLLSITVGLLFYVFISIIFKTKEYSILRKICFGKINSSNN